MLGIDFSFFELYNTLMKTREMMIISFTDEGSKQNAELGRQLPHRGYACESYAVKRFAVKYRLRPLEEPLQEWIGRQWGKADFLFIGAAGIAVRMIAPWVKDKFTDSAVVVMDERARYVIPLLSGHMGGAVELAKTIAVCTGAEAVITTATDVQDKFAVDVFARENGLFLTDKVLAKQISAGILEGKKVGFYCAYPLAEGVQIPAELTCCGSIEELNAFDYAIAVSADCAALSEKAGVSDGNKISGEAGTSDDLKTSGETSDDRILYLHPRNLVLGIGCRKGTTSEELKTELNLILKEAGISIALIAAIASIDLKKDEPGIHAFARECGVPFVTFSADELEKVEDVTSSSVFVKSVTGVDNVCERAALRYCPQGKLVMAKTKGKRVTAAVVEEPLRIHF